MPQDRQLVSICTGTELVSVPTGKHAAQRTWTQKLVAPRVNVNQKDSNPRLGPSVQSNQAGAPTSQLRPFHASSSISSSSETSSGRESARVLRSPNQTAGPASQLRPFHPRSSTSSSSKTGSARGSARLLGSPSRPCPGTWTLYRPKSICGRTAAGIAHSRGGLLNMTCINVPMDTRLQPKHGFYMSGGTSSTPHFPGVSSADCRRPYASAGSMGAHVRTVVL